MDPELEGPVLPSKNEEFKPFVRRLPEFKFWCDAVLKTVPFLYPIVIKWWVRRRPEALRIICLKAEKPDSLRVSEPERLETASLCY